MESVCRHDWSEPSTSTLVTSHGIFGPGSGSVYCSVCRYRLEVGLGRVASPLYVKSVLQRLSELSDWGRPGSLSSLEMASNSSSPVPTPVERDTSGKEGCPNESRSSMQGHSKTPSMSSSEKHARLWALVSEMVKVLDGPPEVPVTVHVPLQVHGAAQERSALDKYLAEQKAKQSRTPWWDGWKEGGGPAD